MAVEDDEEELHEEELDGDELEDQGGDDDDLDEEDEASDAEQRTRAPWHFKILLVGTVGYLLYRLYQGIGWLLHHV